MDMLNKMYEDWNSTECTTIAEKVFYLADGTAVRARSSMICDKETGEVLNVSSGVHMNGLAYGTGTYQDAIIMAERYVSGEIDIDWVQ